MAAKKAVKAKTEKSEVTRTKMADEAAEAFFEKHCKQHEITGTEKAKFAIRYAGRRLAALYRDNKKKEAA